MKTPVHILATCINPDLVRGTTLVFDTLRVGFPESPVTIWLNGNVQCQPQILDAAMKAGCDVRDHAPTSHHEWITELLKTSGEPFWILDTDVIFRGNIEDETFSGPLSGAYFPEFDCKWSRCRTMPRLHTSLLRFDPEAIEAKLKALPYRRSRFTPQANLIHPVVLPPNTFYDTCALLYQAIGGTPFNDQVLSKYEHLNGATWADELEDAYPGIREKHKAIYDDPSLAKGSNFAIQSFLKPEEVIERLCVEVCRNQTDALAFCRLWFRYCHLIDDLVDMEERPSAEMLLEGFAIANVLYSSPFYEANRTLLQPVVLSITNAYADSVKWEGSAVHRRKTIADVLRCCGNEMFFMVAYICGGWQHQRNLSARIREHSWICQHDSEDNPT